MMYEANHPIYQITTTGSDGQTLRIKLTAKPLLVGSNKTAQLILEGVNILPIHVRLMLSTSGQVLLTNMGDPDSVLLENKPVDSFTPINWKPGSVLRINDYVLELEVLEITGTSVQREHVHSAAVTQDNEVISPPGDVIVYWGDEEEEASPGTLHFSGENLPSEPLISETGPVEQSELPPPEEMPLPQLADDTNDIATDLIAETRPSYQGGDSTEAMPFFPYGTPEVGFAEQKNPEHELPPPTESGTLPKDWKNSGGLSAQLTINPIYMAAGEQVRMPVSLRNQGNQDAQIRLVIAGLSRQWVQQAPNTIQLAPGETQSVDLLLHIPENTTEIAFDCVLRIYDRAGDGDATLMLPFEIILKAQPILTGGLNPAELLHSAETVLTIQNHTQADADILIAGHTDSASIRAVPSYPQVTLPPGQSAQIPITIHTQKRHLLRRQRIAFAVSAAHSSRAPLNFPGTIVIPPRLPLIRLLLIAALAAILVFVLLLMTRPTVDNASNQPAPTPSLTSPIETDTAIPPSQPAVLVSPSPENTHIPSETPTVRPSLTPTLPPTATHAPLIGATGILPTPVSSPLVTATSASSDARMPGCDTPIPTGWQPYVVQPGDRVFRLAVDFGATVDEIATVNCLANPRLLQVGQMLLLPPK
ncbi:MAG: LysM peptidoglycan-binding domain-containing protein [Anaerolineaceae bacterium]|nr:LysM peptidoglycan-binding domain-containing protein [Anaerolineaceae bacterium]